MILNVIHINYIQPELFHICKNDHIYFTIRATSKNYNAENK